MKANTGRSFKKRLSKISLWKLLLMVAVTSLFGVANADDSACETKPAVAGALKDVPATSGIEIYKNYAFLQTLTAVKLVDLQDYNGEVIDVSVAESGEGNVSFPVIEVLDNYLYIIKRNSGLSEGVINSLEIYDISDVYDIRLVSSLILDESNNSVSSVIAIEQNTLVTLGEEIVVIDTSDKSSPKKIAVVDDERPISFGYSPEYKDGYLYAVYMDEDDDGQIGQHPGVEALGIKVVDLSDRENPQVIDDVRNTGAIALAIKGNDMYAAHTDGGWIRLDISDPANIAVVAEDSSLGDERTSVNAAIYENNFYLVNFFSGLQIYDINDSMALKNTIPVTAGDGRSGAFVYAQNDDIGIVGMLSETVGAFVIQDEVLTLPESGSYLHYNSEEEIVPVVAVNDHVFITDSEGAITTLIKKDDNGKFEVKETFENRFPIGAKGDYIFLGEESGAVNAKLNIYKMNQDSSLTLLKTIETSGPFIAKIDDNRLYYTVVHDFKSGSAIHVVDIADPANASEIAQIQVDFRGLDFEIVGNTLFRYTGDGIEALDISYPAAPKSIGTVEFKAGAASKIWLESNNNALFAITLEAESESQSRMAVFDIRNPALMINIGDYMIPRAQMSSMKMIHDNLLVIDDIDEGVALYDISNPFDVAYVARVDQQRKSFAEIYAVDGASLYLGAKGIIKSFDLSCIISESCSKYSARIRDHEKAGRVYSVVDNGYWWNPSVTSWYTVGSDEKLSGYRFTSVDLYSTADGIYTTQACDVQDYAPVVSLLGEQAVTLNVGGVYVEPGYKAADDIDGDITSAVIVSGEVNTAVAGEYLISYRVTDSAGNTSGVKTRKVTVLEMEGCYEYTATLQEHELANRATSENEGAWWWYDGITTWYAAGSEEVMGDSATKVVTLNQTEAGIYHLGGCPAAPVFENMGVSISGAEISIRGEVRHNTDTFPAINLHGSVNGKSAECNKLNTSQFRCVADISEFIVNGFVDVKITATDSSGETAEYTRQVFLPETFSPAIKNIKASQQGSNVTISGDIVDPDSEEFEIILGRTPFSPALFDADYQCEVVNKHFVCTMELAVGNYSVIPKVKDADGNTGGFNGDYSFIFVVFGEERCVTAINSRHITEGRAMDFGSAAIYQPDEGLRIKFIGGLDQTTSLQNSGKGYWEVVESCD